MDNQLRKKILIEGTIKTLTGLRIGGSSSAMSIGGIDNIIIRNPIDNKPYIPGSSLKGKMRSMIELRDGTVGKANMGAVTNGPSEDPATLSCRLFGNSIGDDKQRPSRIIVRDAALKSDDEMFKNADVPYAEIKTEVVIDRITSAAMLRQMERVPAGAEFSLSIVINIFEESEEKELVNATYDALRLLQDDYLGGSGSRGYGQIKFNITSARERTDDFYKGNEKTDKDYSLVPVPADLR